MIENKRVSDSPGRWCDLCREFFSISKLVNVHCGAYICEECILGEADKILLKRRVNEYKANV